MARTIVMASRTLFYTSHGSLNRQNIVYMAHKPGLDTENQLNFVRNYANIFERDFYSRNFCTTLVSWAGLMVGMYGRSEVERDRELRIDDETMGWLSWLNSTTRKWAAWVEIGRHAKLVGSIWIKPVWIKWNNLKTIKKEVNWEWKSFRFIRYNGVFTLNLRLIFPAKYLWFPQK